MALTPAERKRLQREREKERAKSASEITTAYLRKPFSEWIKDHSDATSEGLISSEFEDVMNWAGIQSEAIPRILDDTDPAFDSNSWEQWDQSDEIDRGSIGRAERMSSMLLDASRMIANEINKYKRSEVAARIRELEVADLGDPADRKKALTDIVRLNKILDRLSKEVRHTFPVMQVKGE